MRSPVQLVRSLALAWPLYFDFILLDPESVPRSERIPPQFVPVSRGLRDDSRIRSVFRVKRRRCETHLVFKQLFNTVETVYRRRTLDP